MFCFINTVSYPIVSVMVGQFYGPRRSFGGGIAFPGLHISSVSLFFAVFLDE